MAMTVLAIPVVRRTIKNLAAWNCPAKTQVINRKTIMKHGNMRIFFLHFILKYLRYEFQSNLFLTSLNFFIHVFRYLFFMDINNVTQSLKICVKECPNVTLHTMEDICDFYEKTGSQLCHDKPNNDFGLCKSNDERNKTGSCPFLPVYSSSPILNRCIPNAVKEVGKTIVSNFYGAINSWDFLEQVFGDMYKTWKEILFLCMLAMGKFEFFRPWFISSNIV